MRTGTLWGAAGMAAAVASALAPADVITDWNTVILDTIRANRTNPPVATRAMAMMHVAMYDAISAIDRTHEPFHSSIIADPRSSREAAAAQAAHDILVALYPNDAAIFDAKLEETLAQIPNGRRKNAGTELGTAVAAEILYWRSTDGWDMVIDYIPGDQPGQWRPTPPLFLPALLPHWGLITPWSMESGSQFRPGPPPALDSVEYAEAINEVKALGDADSEVRTDEQTEIAWFWEDGAGTCTPPGHWNLIAQHCSAVEGYGLSQNARLFAMLNVTLADAAILAWNTKFEYNLWRPYHAITLADQDGNPLTEPDPDWSSFLPTPPFPEYTSGHSTFSGGSAKLLGLFFGRDAMSFDSSSDQLPGVIRSFTSFSEAAMEAGRSRIYGGIHYEFANQAGLSSGRDLARHVFKRYFQPVTPDPILAMPYPGIAGEVNTFEVFNAGRQGEVYLIYGRNEGTYTVNRCPGLNVDIAFPIVAAVVEADRTGYATVEIDVPSGAARRPWYFQAVVSDTCEKSNLISYRFQ